MKDLAGRVALVGDGGGELGRAVSLALAARGVGVIVVGPVEKALGETVGEIAYGGGKARHVVAALDDEARLAHAVERAVETFGALDIAVAAVDPGGESVSAATSIFRAAESRLEAHGRLLAVSGASDASGLAAVVAAAAWQGSRKATCNAVLVARPEGGSSAIEPEEVAGIVLFFASGASRAISGQAITVGGLRA